MSHIWVDDTWKDSLTFMLYISHNTENSSLISLAYFDLFIVIVWFGRDNGIFNLIFSNLEYFIMNTQTAPDPHSDMKNKSELKSSMV